MAMSSPLQYPDHHVTMTTKPSNSTGIQGDAAIVKQRDGQHRRGARGATAQEKQP